MLATAVEAPFTSPDWLYEIKWDGYRAIAFLRDGTARFVSRNQNDLSARYPELAALPESFRARIAILDGEIVALDEQGRSSFSLMQQRSGFHDRVRRGPTQPEIPVLYYAFDLLYLEGLDLHRVALEKRKSTLASLLLGKNNVVRFSDHFPDGKALYEIARKKGLEGILAKKRASFYEERRSQQWLKIKITHRVECVIGGYTDPEGSRSHFGSVVLGLYDPQGRLIHVGQAGSGFDQQMLEEVGKRLRALGTRTNPFHGKLEAPRSVHWVKPQLVAEIQFSEWTHPTEEGGPKLRAPVFLGLREDKNARECMFEEG